MCWRVYVVWGHNKRVLAVAIALLAALTSRYLPIQAKFSLTGPKSWSVAVQPHADRRGLPLRDHPSQTGAWRAADRHCDTHFLCAREYLGNIDGRVSCVVSVASALCLCADAEASMIYRQCRREIRRFFKKTSHRTFTESILTLFVETGTIYTILWVCVGPFPPVSPS